MIMDAITKQVLINGKSQEVKFVDGTAETVTVRRLPVKCFPAYLAGFEDEVATVALFTDKPVEWVERLSLDSFQAIIEEGERLNLDSLQAFSERRRARCEKLIPGFNAELKNIIISQLANASK